MNNKIIFIIYIIVINIIAFLTMLYDKKRAQNHDYRISEKSLFLLALFLGGIGIYAGMFKFRHKTKHISFLIIIPIMIVLNIISVYMVFSYVLPKI